MIQENYASLHSRFFRPVHVDRMQHAEDYTQLRDIYLEAMRQAGGVFDMVSGPMTTGGFGNRERNFEAYYAVVVYLSYLGRRVVSPYNAEPPLQVIMRKYKAAGADVGYPFRMIKEFYGGLYWSGLVGTVWRMELCDTSTGSTEEHSLMKDVLQADRFPFEVCNLAKGTTERALKFYRDHVTYPIAYVANGSMLTLCRKNGYELPGISV